MDVSAGSTLKARHCEIMVDVGLTTNAKGKH